MAPVINLIKDGKHEKELPLQNVNVFSLKNSLNPFYYFFFLRKAKQCNVFHYHYLQGMFLNRLFNLALCFIVKFPHGPSIITVVEDRLAVKKRFLDLILYRSSDIIEVFSQESKDKLARGYDISPKKITVLEKDFSNIKSDYKTAFFLNGCGHPLWIYKQKRQKERVSWLKERSAGKKLEVGCATGYIIDYVGGGVGIDLDEDRLDYARQKYNQSHFIVADAGRMPFTDKEFDSVLIPEILEHVPFEKAKEIVNGCCRIGKKLLITVPNASKPNYDKNLVENPEHLWLPAKEKMFELLGKDINIEYTKKNDFMLITKLC